MRSSIAANGAWVVFDTLNKINRVRVNISWVNSEDLEAGSDLQERLELALDTPSPAGLRPFFQDGRAHHHGPSWQYACKMVGASGRRVFGQDLLPELTAAELVRRFRAEDVRAFDMCGYIRMWNRLPSEPQQSARWMAAVERNNHRDRVFYPGDEVLFPQRGFGRVLAMEPVPSGQLLYIRFESGVEETLHARYVCKVVDGVIKTEDVRRKRCV